VHTGLWGNLREKERDHLYDLSLDVRIILKWISKEGDRQAWTGLFWLKIGTVGALF
jgi:hypothetical protein